MKGSRAERGSRTPQGLLDPSSQSDQVVAYFRSLKHIQSKRYRDTGVYKAVREAALLADSVLVVLTALESNTEALIEAASTHQEHGVKIIVAQIGATWRLTSSLDHVYENYQRNIHTLMRVRTEGLTIFDARPERVMETIVKDLGRSLTVASTTLPT